MKGTPKNIPSPYKFKGTKIFRDTTALPFLTGGPLVDKTNHGKLLNSIYASELGNYYANGGLIKRADGSYSQRGLWDNIRANKGSGKKPTKEMLAQERKINREYRTGGQFPRPYSLPEDSFKQGGNNLHNSIYASSPAQYPAVYRNGGMTSRFYASNVPDNNISNKDLTYPENSYVYTVGGTLNNFTMNKYPDVTNVLKDGSGIHINPKNKGKFTASANAAGMGVQEFASHVLANKDNYSSTQVKRANFARNAAGWKHANGGHILAAGGWPPGLKLKDPFVSVMPLYRNALYSPLPTNSAEIALEGKLGKKKEWTIAPHIGTPYNNDTNIPISGGLDASFKGLPSPNKLGNAQVDLSTNYNPTSGLGAGVVGGYNYNFGRTKSRRMGEIKPGAVAGNIMPYAGFNYFRPAGGNSIETDQLIGADNPLAPVSGFLYGLKGGLEWRPKFGNKAPITVFGKADVNLNPKAVKANIGATAGIKMPMHRIKENLPQRKISENSIEEPIVGPGDYTFSQRIPSVDDRGKPILGEYEEDLGNFQQRGSSWGSNKITPNFATDWDTRAENGELPFQQIDYTQPIEDDFKYGGTMNFKYGGFNNPGFNALPKDVQAKIKARTFANGGTMPQLTEFNEGGRHEENPLGGIPQGSAPDGRLNLVEEGETKLNVSNYIFSDTLKLDKEIATAFNLPKGDVGKTFADISKKMNRPNSRRDNDTIEQNAKQRDLENLMQAQEAFKAVDLQKDMEMMQRKHPEMMEAFESAMNQQGQEQVAAEEMMQQGQPQMSPEEQQMMMAQQQGGMPEEQMGQIPMSYGGSIFAKGGKMCMTGGRMYPNGGALDMPYTVSGNMPAYDNRAFMSPAEMQNYPMFGSEKEALLWMQNPENEASVAQWEFPEKGIGGQVRSNFYMNPNQPATGVYPGGANANAMRKDLGVYDTPKFSFDTAGNNLAGYRAGGHMYSKGGNVMRSIGAGAYGVGEGLLDTLTFGLTDPLTDKGYDALANIGGRDEKDLERDRMIRGFSNTAGAITGAVVSGGAATGSAISQGSKGLGEGLSNIYGTNDKFDKTVQSLAKVGSVVGGFVGGGNPAGGLGSAAGAAGTAAQGASQVPQFAQTMMQAGQNPFLKQVVGMGSGMIPQKNGGHLYPTIYPRYKNNAGPMGQRMDVLFNYGGSLQAPRQQMYMPLDNVERMGGMLYDEGGVMGNVDEPYGIDPRTGMLIKDVAPLTSYLTSPEAAIAMGYDPKVVAEWTDPNTGEYEVPPAYRLEEDLSNFVSGLAGNPNILEGAATSAANAFRAPIERMPYLKPGQISPKIAGELAGLSDVENIDPSIVNNTLSTQNNLLQENNTESNDEPIIDNDTKVNFTILNANTNTPKVISYTKEEALESPELLAIMDAEEIADYFDEAGDTGTFSENNEGSGNGSNVDYEETDLEREIRLAEEAVKNAETEEEKKRAQEYLSELKRANMQTEDRMVDLKMKQTLPQFLGLAAPAAYNIGMGLFGKTAKYNLEDYLNKSKITPYEVNVDPQLNQTRLAYNAAQEAVRNAAPGSGAYLSNLANIASRRSASFKDILAGKENADKQLKMQADIYNANIKGQNAETALKVQDLNYRGKAAKQQMLGKGLEQLAQMSEAGQTMDAQEKYMRLLSPQYGKTFEYKSIFDQAMDALKNRKNNTEV